MPIKEFCQKLNSEKDFRKWHKPKEEHSTFFYRFFENPQNVKFIAIPGVLDIAIKNNILYADNFTDLVALNIADLENIEVVNRVENLYPEHQNYYPANFEGYFECVDPEKGVVIGWEEVELRNPQCRR